MRKLIRYSNGNKTNNAVASEQRENTTFIETKDKEEIVETSFNFNAKVSSKFCIVSKIVKGNVSMSEDEVIKNNLKKSS